MTRRLVYRRRRIMLYAAAVLVLVLAVCVFLAWFYNLIPRPYYTGEDFGVETVYSPLDQNGNGVDDYTDILLGARRDAENKPRYDGSYREGGYPPEDVGVCTDVIWRALEYAGYDLKALVDADIAQNPHLYPGLDEDGPDPNIDFRRVRNLKVYLDRHAQALTVDLTDIAAWQPGDIVTFDGGTTHIGVVSDKRNRDGVPWLIHNSGQPNREEDALEKLAAFKEITGHYRWREENP